MLNVGNPAQVASGGPAGGCRTRLSALRIEPAGYNSAIPGDFEGRQLCTQQFPGFEELRPIQGLEKKTNCGMSVARMGHEGQQPLLLNYCLCQRNRVLFTEPGQCSSNNCAPEGILANGHDLPPELLGQPMAMRMCPMLQQVLQNIITVGMARDSTNIREYGGRNALNLGWRTVFKQPLDDAASILVASGQLHEAIASHDFIDDELAFTRP
mmetsp:Transcript_42312/g.78799  ORF Transcript_42312/g.78799 Transcript_42312/m.78799 type:complete len:211 (-) Transcript_42312:535-1167(-)